MINISAPPVVTAQCNANNRSAVGRDSAQPRVTREKVGNTSLFEAQADWLKNTPKFDAVLKEITVRTKTYTNIAFNFPKGSDEPAKK